MDHRIIGYECVNWISRDSTVSQLAGYEFNDWGLISDKGRYVSLRRYIQPGSGVRATSCVMGIESFSQMEKLPERQTDLSLPTRVEVKSKLCFLPLPHTWSWRGSETLD